MINFDSCSKKRVSYIIPTKNRASYLDEALMRCRKLKGPDDEVIVIDGGSTDGTKEIVKKYPDVVDIFVSEPDLDGCHGQNKGLLLANGKYTRLLADDDITHKEGIEQAVSIMEAHSEIDILLCGGVKEDTKGKQFIPYLSLGTNFGENIEDAFKYPGIVSGCGHIVRRKSMARFGLFPFGFNADNVFVLNFLRYGATVRYARINLYHHALQSDSITVRNGAAQKLHMLHLAKKYCSTPFFIKFLARETWKNNVFLRPFRFAALALRRKTYKEYKKIFNIPKKPKLEYVWDGKIA